MEKIKVMVVDDAAFMRMLIKGILEETEEIEVIGEANDGLEAISLYKELKPDVVTMDITMPKMDGIEAVKKIKEIDPYAKIIISSAMGQQSMVIEAIQSGAKDFIVKPFKPERVVSSITDVYYSNVF